MIIKNRFVYILILCTLFFTGCGVNPSRIELLSPASIVKIMNRDFEGTFTYLNHKTDNEDKYIMVEMNCEVDGKVFVVTTCENHKSYNYFTGPYYNLDGDFDTDYYAKRFGAEAADSLIPEIYDYFDKYKNVDGFGVYICKDNNTVDLDVHLKTMADYADYVKKNKSFNYTMIVPFEKESDPVFDLYKMGFWNVRKQGNDYRWVSGSIIYDPDRKIPPHTDVTSDLISELNLDAESL